MEEVIVDVLAVDTMLLVLLLAAMGADAEEELLDRDATDNVPDVVSGADSEDGVDEASADVAVDGGLDGDSGCCIVVVDDDNVTGLPFAPDVPVVFKVREGTADAARAFFLEAALVLPDKGGDADGEADAVLLPLVL